ncbi:sialate:H+ symporter (SHS) family MFS transporter [Segniliparus rugosus ATCC BAA-974]|uniref:Sialate:H+ symporter (SHS) family MFS transporter n=2 Tax=Segniliparus rugosus TaxID=286804 RepID=E5XR82_SEGRC|nr:sialate:H+ symporter (SHS) family MFS transporter [Segniliparus rugosus ATCC BAA-974]
MLDRDQRSAFLASWLGWAMDSFDFFILALTLTEIEAEFHISPVQITYLLTVTLVMRPVGAYLFGIWADKAGRRVPLMANVCFYSAVGFLCAFAPNFTVLLVLRLLYGIGMGGEWGLGAALTMEKVPREKRGFFSGILQAGYASGYLFAAVAHLVVHSVFGLSWRWMFALSIFPAFISIIVRSFVKESEVWVNTQEKMKAHGSSVRSVFFNPVVLRRFLFLVVLMTAFTSLSHGTQDLYPKFLKDHVHGGPGFDPATSDWVMIVGNIGAIIGGVVFGSLSDRIGRRGVIVLGALLTLPLLPLFTLPREVWLLSLGMFLVQATTQGAWAAVPAHLSELSPNAVRGFYPGVTYQLGNLFTSFNATFQTMIAVALGYPASFWIIVGAACVALAALAWFGPRADGVDFAESPEEAPATRN